MSVVLSVVVCLGFFALPLRADTFGNGTNQFTIDFVEVGNPGNADDSGAGGGSYSSPHGGVAYNYCISTYEISQAMIDHATALGMSNVIADAWTGNLPAANLSWYEAAAFVNWMNEDQGYHPAYDLSYSSGWSMNLWSVSDQASTGMDSGSNPYRHKDAFYFLPSEDEWYKAAYHQNDGVTANYWDYPTGSNGVPVGILLTDNSGVPFLPYEVVYPHSITFYDLPGPYPIEDVGIASPYGTFGQAGNVYEWMEGAYDGVNDLTSERRVTRGGFWYCSLITLQPYFRSNPSVTNESFASGLRVASIINTTPSPRLDIMLLGVDEIRLAWSTNDTGFVLECVSTLASENWGIVTNSVVIDGEYFSVTVEAAHPGGYFRLRKD